MTHAEAVFLIQAMIDSLQSNPGQFNVTVNIVGQRVESRGGTGLSIKATGGGPGSTTIGQSVSAAGGDIRLAQGDADAAMGKAVTALVDSLRAIAAELGNRSPDRGRIEGILDSLSGTWVPGVLTSVIGNLITLAFRPG